MPRKVVESCLRYVVRCEDFGDFLDNCLRIGGYKMLSFLLEGFI